MKTVAACLAVACVLAGGAAAGRLTAPGLQPPCPHPLYGADGTMGPIFCVIDNPLALRYYAKLGTHLFALGPDASPGQVLAAARADYRHSTEPILCESYRLAAWREHWRFGIAPTQQIGVVLGFPTGWCSEPRFSVSN